MTWKEDKTLIVLTSGMLFYTCMVMIVVYSKADDAVLYALFSGVFGQFSGALFMHLKGDKPTPPPGSTTRVEQVIETPPVEPKVE